MSNHSIKFRNDFISSFWVIQLTIKQTDIGEKKNSLAEAKVWLFEGYRGIESISWPVMLKHITDNSGITTYGLMALGREMSSFEHPA